jgi:signal transduction histidine kinase
MLRTLRKIPKESRVMVVLSLTVLLQVLVLSVFGLSAVKGLAAEAERDRREICRRVLSRNLVEELQRRTREALGAARNPIAMLRVQSPLEDPVFGRALAQAAAPGHLVRHAFLVLADGSIHDGDRLPLALPATRSLPAGAGDRVSPFETLEREADAGGDPAALAQAVADLLGRTGPEFRPQGLLLLARLERRAGRPEEAIAAFDRICREEPATLLDGEYPPAPIGLEAARGRARLRLGLVAEGRAAPERLVEDILTLRWIVSLNRPLVSKARSEFEVAALADLRSRAGPLLPPAERDRADRGLALLDDREECLALLLGLAGREALEVAAGGRGEETLEKSLPGGTFVVRLLPVRDRAETVTGAVALVVDTARIIDSVLPEILASLPLPDGVAAAVLDASGRAVLPAGETLPGTSLAEARLGEGLPFFTAALFARDPRVGEREVSAARRLHYGTMALAIAGLLAAAWFAFRTVRAELKVARLKSDFLSNVTHELKTPLTSIRMFVETLTEGRVRDDEERAECLGVIARESERLSGLIQRVLDLSRLEARGGASLSRRDTDLSALAAETAEIFRRGAPGEGPSLTVRTGEGLPPFPVDPQAVRQLMLNLLTNAAKYGGKHIVLAVSQSRNAAVIEVSDDGIGIPVEQQGRIFEKFYRVDDRLSRDVEGSGIGLAYVREVARAHGGRVAVRSRQGEGSTFRVTLPGRR